MKAQDSRVQQWGVIAKNKDEYVKLAMKLASDIPALQNLRLSLQKLMSKYLIFDEANVNLGLESVFRNAGPCVYPGNRRTVSCYWHAYAMWLVPHSPQCNLQNTASTILEHIQASAFTNAVKLTGQILAIAPGDEDALRCKVVALIKDDRFDGAISAIQSSKTPSEDFHFLKAY
ncbi:hypothetical protein KIW84_043893 [Lathyrus oleraceus]|uniref:Uncharacterized protein n=1 Tax=Pisum sativum TaxID=3888 RepID=A0A9D4XF05_PEA|nr:hypothetical protein KIW84_043893 [Pisum sativum]